MATGIGGTPRAAGAEHTPVSPSRDSLFQGDRAKITRLEQADSSYVERANRESEELRRRILLLESALRQKDEENKAQIDQVRAACSQELAVVAAGVQSEFDRKHAELIATQVEMQANK